mgnify:CR=1 FL=1
MCFQIGCPEKAHRKLSLDTKSGRTTCKTHRDMAKWSNITSSDLTSTRELDSNSSTYYRETYRFHVYFNSVFDRVREARATLYSNSTRQLALASNRSGAHRQTLLHHFIEHNNESRGFYGIVMAIKRDSKGFRTIGTHLEKLYRFENGSYEGLE